MIELLRRLFDPAYLYALNAGPLGRWGAVYLLWAILLLLGLAASVWGWVQSRARQSASAAAVGAALSCAAGLLAVILRLAAPALSRLELIQGLTPSTRYLLLEAWTARVWPLSATLAALLASLAHALSCRPLPRLLQAHVDAIVGHSESSMQEVRGRRQDRTQNTEHETRNTKLLLALLHLAGLAWLWHSSGHSAWWALPSLAGLAALPLLACRWRPATDGRSSAVGQPSVVRLETLGPMFLAYLSAAAYWFLARRLQIDVDAYQAFALPDPWSPWFNVPAVVTASVALTLLIQVRLFVSQENRVSALPVLLALLTALWLAATVVVHRTHGVTASDPYCYVQMAIDLAERGTALHAFPLAGLARDLGLPTWPAVHIGYHPPGLDDLAPTMWSTGWPLLMAPLYRLGGLQALYWAAPWMSLLALIATWFLANEALRDLARPVRRTVAALCCALVATSPEGSERMLVPMADAAAQLFTVLTLWLLARAAFSGGRQRGATSVALYGALAGACFGAAYWIRHPQLPLGVAAVAAAILSVGATSRQERESATRAEHDTFAPRSRRVHDSPDQACESRTRAEQGKRTSRSSPDWVRGGILLLSFALAALAIALPDLAYHRAAFGGWLNSESSEWFLLSARNVGRSLFGVLQQGLLRREEIGYLAPFALYGGWLLARPALRGHRRAAWVLFSGAGAVFLFHLFYAALRPRDLIAILPVFYLGAAYGFVELWRRCFGAKGSPTHDIGGDCFVAKSAPRNDRVCGRGSVLAALLLVACMTFLFARSYRTLALPWREDVITFGHVRADQLAEFQRLRELTPEDAVIGSMLNGGAIELHAGRAAVHPTPWTEDQLARWVEGLWSEGHPFYLLDDGEEMHAVIERLEERYAVRPVATLGLPYFAIGGGNLPRSARLYRIEEP